MEFKNLTKIEKFKNPNGLHGLEVSRAGTEKPGDVTNGHLHPPPPTGRLSLTQALGD